jgi:hypothetical protein
MSQGMLRGVGKGGNEQQVSPIMAEAVRLYFEHPTLTAVQALKLGDFSKEEAELRTKQNTLTFEEEEEGEVCFGKIEQEKRGAGMYGKAEDQNQSSGIN